MIYNFKCSKGHQARVQAPMVDGPPDEVSCTHPVGKVRKTGKDTCEQSCCGELMDRDWKTDVPMLNTSACRDHSEIREDKRVRSAWDGNQSPEAVEAGFKRHIAKRRSQISDAGGQRGSIKQTHAVPAHLFHGKIKETGDKNYWADPKNLNRHNECKVDK